MDARERLRLRPSPAPLRPELPAHQPRSQARLLSARKLLTLVALVGVGACSSLTTSDDFGPTDSDVEIVFEAVAVGLEAPVYLASPPADPRLFVLEQRGRVRVITDGSLVTDPFLDITDLVRFNGEQGLLGLAFDPDYRANGRFFVYYTDVDGNSVLAAYNDIDRGDRADPGSRRVFLEVEQPFANHNGGQLAFGPDQMLYVGLGDGGSAGDPLGNGQDPSSLLGSILRLNVLDELEPPYRIPLDNPFVDDPTKRPEIWHYGLRNPWRFSFDRDGRRMYIGDVGQDRWEEINVVAAGTGGLNFGWNVMEGPECFGGASCEAENLSLPTAVYGHEDGCSVTGGYVYDGLALPALSGRYLYADYCEGWIRSFRIGPDGSATDPEELAIASPGRISSFGRDAQGELYVTVNDGRVLKLVPKS